MVTEQQLWHFAENVSTISKQEPAKAKALLQAFIKEYQRQPDVLAGLAAKFYKAVEYTLAGFCYDALAQLHPNNPVAYNGLGMVLTRFGETEKAAKAYEKALTLKPDYKASRTNHAFVLHYFGKTGRPEILKAQQNVAKHVYPSSKNFLKDKKPILSDSRPIKLGYVSGDLRDHPVGHFMKSILKHHDRSRFEIHVFDSFSDNNDFYAESLKGLDLKWHDISAMKTQAACSRIVRNEIDMLFDLGGYTGTGRADIFSNRVAPVQVNYLGYPDSTGMPTMDVRIGDNYADLSEFECQNTERMQRLPCAMWLYDPWEEMPSAKTKSAFESNGYITFGSANNHAKLQTEWLEVWARLLSRVPNSRILMKSRVLDNADVRNKVSAIFHAQGVDPTRIDFRHYSRDQATHWREMQEIDIALDAFPYNGTTTTCDMLWLGNPVMTMAGNSHSSRTSASMLHTLGMEDWIATTESEFIERCIQHASNLEQLSLLHQNLRQRMLDSSLCDPDLFMPQYEQLLRSTWHDHCKGTAKR